MNWQPSDATSDALDSIAAWRDEAGLANLAAPLRLDVTVPDWARKIEGPLDAMLAINLVHIAPWAAAEGLFAGAGRLLAPGGLLYLYGAYRRNGEHTAPSNADFDAWLKRHHPAWGVRDMEAIESLGAANGLGLDAVVAMPANNFSLIFRKNAGS